MRVDPLDESEPQPMDIQAPPLKLTSRPELTRTGSPAGLLRYQVLGAAGQLFNGGPPPFELVGTPTKPVTLKPVT